MVNYFRPRLLRCAVLSIRRGGFNWSLLQRKPKEKRRAGGGEGVGGGRAGNSQSQAPNLPRLRLPTKNAVYTRLFRGFISGLLGIFFEGGED